MSFAKDLQAHWYRHIPTAIVKQPGLLGRTNQVPCKRACLDLAALIKLAEMCDRLLNDTPPDTHAAHQAPITVDLPVFLANHVAQIHAPSQSLRR